MAPEGHMPAGSALQRWSRTCGSLLSSHCLNLANDALSESRSPCQSWWWRSCSCTSFDCGRRGSGGRSQADAPSRLIELSYWSPERLRPRHPPDSGYCCSHSLARCVPR